MTESSPKSTQCEPGTNWKEDCNSCWLVYFNLSFYIMYNKNTYFQKRCTEHGQAACTLMGCISHDVSKRSTMDVYSADFKCEPNKSFTHPDGCNNCKCGSEGSTLFCTKQMCPSVSNISKRSAVDVYSPNFKCNPNQSFTHPDGCNSCKCGPEGSTLFCTKKMCPTDSRVSKRSTINVYSPDFKCEPNNTFTHPDGCNNCKCSSEGSTLFCTRKLCPPVSHITKRSIVDIYSADFKCEPNISFTHPDGCNNCKCNNEGKTQFCTKMMCERIENAIERSKRFVEDVLRIKRDSNNDPASPDFSCEPKQSFKHKDGCNDCV